jgi:hypothetical protein
MQQYEPRLDLVRCLRDSLTKPAEAREDLIFQAELRFLGVTSSPAFVRAPEGNGVAERFIRTLKEQLVWVRTFHTVEDLRCALHDGLRLYNEQWFVARHGFRSPIQVRRNLLATLEAA